MSERRLEGESGAVEGQLAELQGACGSNGLHSFIMAASNFYTV